MRDKYPIIFEVPATPSLNILHSNKWQMVNWKKKFLKIMKNFHLVYNLKEKVKMKITYQRFGVKELDQENYFGSTKPLTDAIKECKMIVDDNQKWLKIIHLPQVIIHKLCEQKTVVKVEKAKGK